MALLAIGLAVGGGILNALSGAEANRAEEKRAQQALALLRENIIDPDELDALMRDINSTFNNRLVTTLNSTALTSRGVANAQVAKGVAAGQVEGERLGTLKDARFRVMESNKQTNAAMASVIAGTPAPSSGIGDFFTGALTAAPIGIELGKMLDPEIATTLAAGDGSEKGLSGRYDGPSYGKNSVNLSGTFGDIWGDQDPGFTLNQQRQNYWFTQQAKFGTNYGRGQ